VIDKFQHPYLANWCIGFEGDEVRVTDTCEDHVKRLANWNLDELFARRYPELRDDCKAGSRLYWTPWLKGYELGKHGV